MGRTARTIREVRVMVGEVCNMENGCVPGRSMNIKEKLLASADMQRKAIEILSAIMRDVTGAERGNGGPG